MSRTLKARTAVSCQNSYKKIFFTKSFDIFRQKFYHNRNARRSYVKIHKTVFDLWDCVLSLCNHVCSPLLFSSDKIFQSHSCLCLCRLFRRFGACFQLRLQQKARAQHLGIDKRNFQCNSFDRFGCFAYHRLHERANSILILK